MKEYRPTLMDVLFKNEQRTRMVVQIVWLLLVLIFVLVSVLAYFVVTN